MKNLSLTATIYIVLSLLFVIGNFTAVMANPGRIEEPSFETVANWTYSETVGSQFTDGVQSAAWATQLTNSYLFSSASPADIQADQYCQILQSSVDFDLIDRISFDTYLYSDSPNFSARMLVGATQVWSLAVPEPATEYLHVEVDLSAQTGVHDFIIRIYCLSKSNNAAMLCYFDNIKIWGSHSNSLRTIIDNDFTAYGDMVYMYGENFDITGTYKVGYYDGGTLNDGADGAQVEVDLYTDDPDGILDESQCRPADYGASSYGTWNAVIYKTTGDMPASYDLVNKGDAAYAVSDSFYVQQEAIPEFSTVIAAIGVAGLCFGIYWWMRKRVHRVHGVA